MGKLRGCWFILLLLLASCVSNKAENGSLSVVAVQLSLDKKLFTSSEAYFLYMDALLNSIDKEYHPDLIVFPEYTGVFLALIPYSEILENAESIAHGLCLISAKNNEIHSFNSLFIESASFVENLMYNWGKLAEKYSVAIIPGTYFASVKTGQDKQELRNRVLVFDASGGCIYTQDKVFLTEFEIKQISISPGKIDCAGEFYISGRKVVLILCRDTFFPEWEDYFSSAYLWIDIKANGIEFTEDEEKRFLNALPSRISGTEVPFGLTVCLTGEYLDLFWEGESSFIRKTSGGFKTIKKTETCNRQEILFYKLP